MVLAIKFDLSYFSDAKIILLFEICKEKSNYFLFSLHFNICLTILVVLLQEKRVSFVSNVYYYYLFVFHNKICLEFKDRTTISESVDVVLRS